MSKFLSAQEIARQALPILKDNLVFPMLSYVEYSDDFARRGDTVQIRKPPVYKASEFTGEIVKQDAAEEAVLVTLDKIADVSIEIGPREMALQVEDFNTQVLEPAMAAIAEKINSDGMELYRDIPYVYGTAGSTPDDLSVFAGAAKMLNRQKAPVSPRYGVWDYEALSKLQVIPAVVNAEKSGDTQCLRDGSIGRILGMENFMSQAVKNHASGKLTSAKVKAEVPAGTGEIVLTAAEGDAVKRGDLLTVSGVTYTVTADAQADGTDLAAAVYPPVPEKIEANAPAALTADHTANLAFHKNAFAFVTRPLEAAKGAESYVVNYEGITLRVTMDYDIATKKQILSVDTLYGFKTIYPELACRILG